MTQRGLRLGFLFLVSFGTAQAYLPPVTSLLTELVDLRTSSPEEVVWRHRILGTNGEVIEIDESLFCDRGNLSIHWRTGGQTIVGQFGSKGYTIPAANRTISIRSALYAKLMCATSAEELREALIQERFLRREQTAQFKPSYQPTGDPNLWDTKNNYIIHDDIALRRLKSGIAIAVVGTDGDNPGRTVFFDRASSGIARLEWRNGPEIVAWNFDKFAATEGRGLFPRRSSFEVGGAERVTSEMILARAFSDKTANTYRADRHRVVSAVPAENILAALGILLSYR